MSIFSRNILLVIQLYKNKEVQFDNKHLYIYIPKKRCNFNVNEKK